MKVSPESAVIRWSTFAGPGARTPAVWCDAVGPAVHREGGGAVGAVEELVVATWNVRVGGGDLLAFVEDLRSGALTGRPARDFVLLVQEAYRAGPEVPFSAAAKELTSRIDAAPPSGARLDVREAARRLDLHAFYAPSMPNGSAPGALPEDRGNAILSTLPLTELAAIELPFEVQRRVAVAATVQGVDALGNRWRLRLASGHLDTRSRPSRLLDSFGRGRGRQADALSAWLDGHEAALLGADLNTWSLPILEGALERLERRFPDTPSAPGATFVAAGVIPRRLDHLLARLPEGYLAEAQRVPTRYGSDHHPLVGRVRFGESSGGGERHTGG